MPAPQINFEEAIKGLVAAGWTVKSDGPTGVQMEGPKKMAMADKIVILIGTLVALFANWIIGAVLIGAGVFDFAFLTKGESKFFPRR